MAMPQEVAPLVRTFKNNGFKFLFSQGENTADILRWKAPKVAKSVDLAQLSLRPGSFIAPDFQQLESDVLLRAPFLNMGADLLWLYVLMEHQSEPDELMVFRCLRYVVLIYEQQAGEWLKTHPNLRDFDFHPVLPIVFYWGTRSWPKLTPMSKLVKQSKLLGKAVPEMDPIFINLAKTKESDLQKKVGLVGSVLWTVQQRKRKLGPYREVLRGLVEKVNSLPDEQQSRGQSLLWFAHALMYHDRTPEEREACAAFIREAASATLLPEILNMQKTIAEDLKDQGKREALVRLLRAKFKYLPTEIETKILNTEDSQQLDGWLDDFAVGKKLKDIDFGLAK